MERSSGCRIEIVTQRHADKLEMDQTQLRFMLDKSPGDAQLRPRTGGASDLSEYEAQGTEGTWACRAHVEGAPLNL